MKNRFISDKLAAIAIVVALSFSDTVAVAQTSTPIKNVVIVHGAFVDASGFDAVYQILKKDGYKVTLVQNPLTSLEDDVKATDRALEQQDGPTVLVGHSWGGTVITQAGVSPKVASLVYVAAFAPNAGESTLGVYQSGPALPKNGILPADDHGISYFDKTQFAELFAGDQTKERAAFMADSQQPIVATCFTTAVTQVAWKTKPTYAIVATEDKAINPVLERSMYKRAKAIVTEIKGSHTIYLSHAQAVAKVIEEASKAGTDKNK